MERITRANLDGQIRIINRLLGTPEEPYTKGEDGKYHANIGNIHLEGAYGGWKASRMVGESGGTQCVTHGYVSKRELYSQLSAFIRGIEAAQAGEKN